MTEDNGNSFFRAATHRVILGSPTLQSSNRRICVPLRMPLTSDSFADMPDWVGKAYEDVSQRYPSVDAPVEVISDIVLAFYNGKPDDKLFTAPDAKVPHSELKKFVILRTEDPDDAEIELQFKSYTSYSGEYWRWLGELAGTKADIYMAFPATMGVVPAPPEKSGTLPLDTARGRNEEVVVMPAASSKPKSGPAQLAEEHQRQLNAGAVSRPSSDELRAMTPRGGKKRLN